VPSEQSPPPNVIGTEWLLGTIGDVSCDRVRGWLLRMDLRHADRLHPGSRAGHRDPQDR